MANSAKQNGCLEKLKLRFFYSAKTQYTLNYVTLSIKDQQVREEYLKTRAEHFDHCFRTMVFLSLLNFMFRTGQHFLL